MVNVSVSISHMFYVLLHPIIWNLVFVLRINCCRDIFPFDFFLLAFFFLLSFFGWVLFMLIFGESAHKAFQTRMVQSIKLHRREWEWVWKGQKERNRRKERERRRAKAPFVVHTAVHAIHQHRFITNIVNYGMLFRLQLHRRRFPSNFCTTWMCVFFLLLRLFCRLFVSWFFSLLLWLGNILQWFLLL